MKNWKLWAGFGIAVLMAAAGIYAAYLWWLADPLQVGRDAEMVAVRRGNLVVTVKAFGAVAIPRRTTLTFAMGGRLTEIRVAEGDGVQEGDVLARLDTTDLEAQVARAEAALSLSRAQLEKVKESSTAADIAAARAAVKSAEENLARVKQGPTEADMAAAQAALLAAQQNLSDLLKGPTSLDLRQAQLALDQARNSLWGAQGNRDAVAGQAGAGGLKANASAQLANAEVAVRQAELRLEEIKLPPTPARVQDARAGVAQAESSIARLEQSPTGADIALAEAQLVQAQARLDALTRGPSAQDMAVAQAQVEQAQIGLEQARRQLGQAVLVAPVGGTVVAVGANAGQSVAATTPIVVLVDLANLQIEANVHESYIGQVHQGQRALIRLEALPGQPLEGRVSEIAPLGTVVAGVASYPVTLELAAAGVVVKPGMTAEVEIVVSQRENALIVPKGALGLVDGRWIVRKGSAGRLVDAEVKTGVRQGRVVEVLEGLAEGDQVLLNAAPLAQGEPPADR